MEKHKSVFTLKDGRKLDIIEGNMPDIMVNGFLDSMDDWAKAKFRHRANSEEEVQILGINYPDPNDRSGTMQIVSYMALYPLDHPSDFTIACAISEGWRGQGLGTYFYELAESICLKHGKEYLVGEVDADNIPPMKILEKRGYTVDGPKYVITKHCVAPGINEEVRLKEFTI